MSENLKKRCIFQDKNPYNLKTNPYNPYNFRVKKNQSVQSVHFGHPADNTGHTGIFREYWTYKNIQRILDIQGYSGNTRHTGIFKEY